MYYVARVDKRTQKVLLFSEVECDSATDAAECEELLQSLFPGCQTLIGYKPDPDEVIAPHVCRGCNCQFDTTGRRIA